MNIETQLKINHLDVMDYISMREHKQASKVKWEDTKTLNLGSRNLWQLCSDLDSPNFNVEFEPSLTTLAKVKNYLLFCKSM